MQTTHYKLNQFVILCRGIGAAASMLALFANVQTMKAADGDLDPTFGVGGKVMTDFNHSTDWANAVAIQPDGKFVVVGTTYKQNDFSDEDFAVARYNTDGTLDSSFGSGGKVHTDFPGLAAVPSSVLLQPDAKILVVGGAYPLFTFLGNIEMVRYNSNGNLDRSFGDNGIVTTKACRYFYPQSITDCYVGVDPTGEKAVPNGRGIFLGARYGYIGGNVISGNARSGLFVNSGAAYIYGNAIGLNAKKTAPLGNGASGVYIAPAAAGTDLTTNHIAFNHHAGVSIAKEATMVEVIGNSIHANWQLAVDYGLDGVTARVPIRAEGPNQTFLGTGSMSMPQITSAVYDSATDTTTIDATIAFERSPAYNSLYLNVYANDAPDESGYGEGQYFLGQVGCGYPTERCTMKLQGRPPGPYISTTGMSWQYYGWLVTDPDGSQFCGDCGHTQTTSEFSKTVRITER